MARIRSIKPSYWEDEKIGRLSWGARLLFIATWNIADDAGRLRWTPHLIRSQVFPYDEPLTADRVQELMDELELHDLVQPYSHGVHQEKLAFIKNFTVHQSISRSSGARLPGPSGFDGDDEGQSGQDADAFMMHSMGEAFSVKRLRNRKEHSASPLHDDRFDEFWSAYPRSHGKINARKSWAKAVTLADADKIIEAARRYAADPNRDPSYTKMGATWLNQNCWDDPPLPQRRDRGAPEPVRILAAAERCKDHPSYSSRNCPQCAYEAENE